MDLIKSRLKFFIIVIILISAGLIFRLFQKQILERDYYVALAKKQYTVTKEILPQRGKIFISDYQGHESEVVAINLHFYDLLIVPKNVSDPKVTARKLANLCGMTEKEIYNQINNDKPYIPPLKKKLSAETAQKIEELGLDGVMLLPNVWRYYPEKQLASHVLGFVDAEGQGRYGVEGYYNQELKGKSSEMDVNKEDLSYLDYASQPGGVYNGSDIYLTIDRNIQFVVEQKLKEAVEKNQAESGSIIISDPKTGKIYAMAAWPNFDPNTFYNQKGVDIFNNSNIAYSYEPGSVFKVFGMAAGLDLAKITPETEQVFGSTIKIGPETIHTSTNRAYGRETMTEILKHSDNVGMVWVAQQLGIDSFYKYIKDFGFGAKSQIDLDTEAKGSVLDIGDWRPITLATNSFGQGIAVTPIQLISAVSAIANGGDLLQPYVVNKIVEINGQTIEKEPRVIRKVMKKESAAQLTDMMVSVVDKGYSNKASVEGYPVAGKTGTAQIPNPDKKGYIEGANIGSFVGFAPAHNPKFTILVKIDKPKNVQWAEDSAAPVFKQMTEWLVNYFQIPKER